MGGEHQHKLENYPQNLYKKVTLLSYFKEYMNEHLLKAGLCDKEPKPSKIPSLQTYFRTKSAIILHFTDGLLQVIY